MTRKMTHKKCPICRSKLMPFNIQELATPRDISICNNCRHICWDEMPSEADITAYYKNDYAGEHDLIKIQEDGRAYYKTHTKELLDKYKSFNGASEAITLVDFGCAWPVFVDEAVQSKLYNDVIGVEFDAHTVIEARQKGFNLQTPDEFFKNTAHGSIDIIRFSHVIEHMIDPCDMLKKIELLLANDALIYITQPIFPMMKTDVPLSALKDSVYPEHLHFFTPHSLQHLLHNIGFKITEMSAFQNEEEFVQLYKDNFDKEYAINALLDLKNVAPLSFKKEGRFPTFFGDNVYSYATRKNTQKNDKKILTMLKNIVRKFY